jgi:hypothetical protein
LAEVIEPLRFGVHQRPVRVLRSGGTSLRLLGNWERLRLRHGARLDRQLGNVRRFGIGLDGRSASRRRRRRSHVHLTIRSARFRSGARLDVKGFRR